MQTQFVQEIKNLFGEQKEVIDTQVKVGSKMPQWVHGKAKKALM